MRKDLLAKKYGSKSEMFFILFFYLVIIPILVNSAFFFLFWLINGRSFGNNGNMPSVAYKVVITFVSLCLLLLAVYTFGSLRLFVYGIRRILYMRTGSKMVDSTDFKKDVRETGPSNPVEVPINAIANNDGNVDIPNTNITIKPIRFKKSTVIFLIVTLIMIATNPTRKDYIEFSGNYESDFDGYGYRRTLNFLIFSVYIDDRDEKKYIGVLKNFIIIKKDE